MNTKLQALLLAVFIIASATLTRINNSEPRAKADSKKPENQGLVRIDSPNLSYQKASLITNQGGKGIAIPRSPSRNWDVLDPGISSRAILFQSLEDHFPFFHKNTYTAWPIASLTKLLTAVVVLEDIGANKKIPIDQKIIETEGEAGNLKSGEVYIARDLLKIMLLTSSNDAATAFENYLGRDEMVKVLNAKARDIGMAQTVLHDASGLSDLNESTASDLLRLARYILENEPEIFSWTRLESILVQPINDINSQTLLNINALVKRDDFLGGKTGTSDEARENLIAIFSLNNYRVIMIILGSSSRYGEVDNLLNWANQAYSF